MDDMGIGLVSVIMAAYNAEKTVQQAILSALGQTYRNLEILVVDDCSTDGTADIVKKLAGEDRRIRLFQNRKNRGVSHARKRALENAAGSWVAILDSDDVWMPEKLEKQIRFQKERNAALIFTGSAFMDADGRKMGWELHVPEELGYRKLLKQNLISNSSVLVKKSLYETFYVREERLHEDFAVWLTLTKTGVSAYGIDEPLLIYRLAGASKSGNKLLAAKMNWNTYRYVGLNVFQAGYYMAWYMVNGVLKYRNLRKAFRWQSILRRMGK